MPICRNDWKLVRGAREVSRSSIQVASMQGQFGPNPISIGGFTRSQEVSGAIVVANGVCNGCRTIRYFQFAGINARKSSDKPAEIARSVRQWVLLIAARFLAIKAYVCCAINRQDTLSQRIGDGCVQLLIRARTQDSSSDAAQRVNATVGIWRRNLSGTAQGWRTCNLLCIKTDGRDIVTLLKFERGHFAERAVGKMHRIRRPGLR